jgi:spermidine dehydrogenase
VPLDPSKPAMLTMYVGFPQSGVPIDRQTRTARHMLFGATYADLELKIRTQPKKLCGRQKI